MRFCLLCGKILTTNMCPCSSGTSANTIPCERCKELEAWLTNPEQLARQFHEIYERLAPQFSYKTRKASAVPWESVPENNKRLMIAVCTEIASAILKVKGEQSEVPKT